MSKPVVKVENLGKKYVIKKQNKVDTIKDLLSGNPLVGRKEPETHQEDFWALKDINFELREGETLGIIGRNGAGKSTLLKILARTIYPTTGKAVIRGKVASLLEVGTGFHTELSGRENVFFNGSLLGMSKVEIASKFQEIVEFSEIGDFIDTPVKHYSSGMKVRLAFSVAAHLDADIMIIDEALAAGDIAFRKKSLEKMRATAFEGRSVLFVTHSMGSAQELCNKTLYLKQGKPVMLDDTDKVIEAYVGASRQSLNTAWKADKSTQDTIDDRIVPQSLSLRVNGKTTSKRNISPDSEIEVEVAVKIKKPSEAMSIGVSVFNEDDRRLFRSAHTDAIKQHRPKLKSGVNKFRVKLPNDLLRPGQVYMVAMDCDIYNDIWIINPNRTEARVEFALADTALHWDPKREGIVKPQLKWESE